jgi:hypothetical protein
LSERDIGVPIGTAVDSVRLTASNMSCDPLGVGYAGEPQQQQEAAMPTLFPAGRTVPLVVLSAAAILIVGRRAASSSSEKNSSAGNAVGG